MDKVTVVQMGELLAKTKLLNGIMLKLFQCI